MTELKTKADRLSVTLAYLRMNGNWDKPVGDPATAILWNAIMDNGVKPEWISDAIAMKWMDGIDHSQLLYRQGMR
tara:strand:+ start:489 stop:713 length:225 start_codon:yes stop_codon:yes gene_type:complete